MAFTALYDANVLHPASLRDLLIRLGQTGLFRARWTQQILDETTESILRRRPDLDAGRLARTRALMCEAVALRHSSPLASRSRPRMCSCCTLSTSHRAWLRPSFSNKLRPSSGRPRRSTWSPLSRLAHERSVVASRRSASQERLILVEGKRSGAQHTTPCRTCLSDLTALPAGTTRPRPNLAPQAGVGGSAGHQARCHTGIHLRCAPGSSRRGAIALARSSSQQGQEGSRCVYGDLVGHALEVGVTGHDHGSRGFGQRDQVVVVRVR